MRTGIFEENCEGESYIIDDLTGDQFPILERGDNVFDGERVSFYFKKWIDGETYAAYPNGLDLDMSKDDFEVILGLIKAAKEDTRDA